ncbi:hypothetical protein QTH97_27150 [Variovorax sp. J22R24]|uniref:hypothetical protein n=1 Tax=Variovorax gracilis TaxID=3053502 RepID=UPI002576A10F|nr:hypothetical protein [Variovorax sp. J22R24]MDM0108653.1 hypothetical protein [Variovorax sp. J22R24]
MPEVYDLLPEEPPRAEPARGQTSSVSILRIDGLDVALLPELEGLEAAASDLEKQMREDKVPSGVIVFPRDAVVRDLEPTPAKLAARQIGLHRSNSESLKAGAEQYINWYWTNRRETRRGLI